MRLQAGQKIGDRYTLQERIGSGGMADVWVAGDSVLGRRVALKFLHESFGEDEQFIERFRREATAAAGLQHPNIVGIYDRGEFDGRHFIAMEYVEGASLKDLINRGLSVAESIEIVRQILSGARFAHERGVIHRDLKPQNVLIDAEGRARVTDFGIARAGASEMTQTGSVLGTAQYLSPEQAQGLETTATSDIYSIGIVLYECLTGRVPFDGDSTVAVALKQVSEQPKPPSQLKPSIPRALDGVVLKALAKDPAERYATAAEFSRALDAAEADPAAQTGSTSMQPAAAAALGAAAGAAMAGGTPPPEEPEEPEPEEEEPWLDRKKAIALAIIVLLLAAVIVYALTRKSENTVPNVKGKSQAAATADLESAGFKVFTDSFESCDKPGTVSEQDPLAGSTADEGDTIKITVQQGPRGERSQRGRQASGCCDNEAAEGPVAAEGERALLAQGRQRQRDLDRSEGERTGAVQRAGRRRRLQGREPGDRARRDRARRGAGADQAAQRRLRPGRHQQGQRRA